MCKNKDSTREYDLTVGASPGRRDSALCAGACSVIICSYTIDRWDDLNAAVASVRNQTLPPQEIIVVIDGNPALFERASREIAGVKVVLNAKTPGLSGGRMTGAELATMPILVFLDDDAFAEPDWLEHLMAAYRDERVLGVGGPAEPLWRSPRPHWFPDEFTWVVGCTFKGMPVDKGGKVQRVIGANMSVRADVLKRVGGFDERLGRRDGKTGKLFGAGEETEFCIRVSRLHPDGVWIYCDKARVHHVVSKQRTTWRYFVRRCRLEGATKALLTKMIGAREGLEAERRYTLTLVGSMLSQIATGNPIRAATMFVGLTITAAAYARGKLGGRVF